MIGGSSEAPRKRPVKKKAVLVSPKPTTVTPKKTVVARVAKKAVARKKTTAITKRAVAKKVTLVADATVPRESKSPTVATVPAASGVVRDLVTERQSRDLAILSPFRFPVDVHKLMTGTARFGGLAFVVIGALFTLLLLPGIWSTDSLQQAGGTPAQVIDSTTNSLEPVSEPIVEEVVIPVVNTITTSQSEPLQGTAELIINTQRASRVELYIFTESWQNRSFLGLAEQVAPDVWHYNWDTTKVVSGLNYRVSAQIWQQSLHSSNPDVTIQTNYMLVDNTPVAAETQQAVVETVDRTPLAVLQVPARVSGTAEVMVEVPSATSLSVVLEHVSSGSRNILYNASQVRPGVWRVLWPTTNFTNGEYRLSARVRNEYGSYVSGQGVTVVANTTIANTVESGDVTDIELTDTQKVVETGLDDATAQPVILPTVTMRTPANTALTGTVQLQARTANAPVSSVYFYVRDQASLQSRFIGVGTKQTDVDWSINWYTNNTPNGTYEVFARAQTQAGSVESSPVRLSVQNQVAAHEPQITIEQRESVITAVREIADVTLLPPPPVETLAVQSPDDELLQAQVATRAPLAAYRTQIDAELQRLGSAYRNGDAETVRRITERIYQLFENDIQSLAMSERETRRSELRRAADEMIATYLSFVDRSTALIRERGRADVLRDTDGDGVSDFDEVTIYSTDPLNPDTDNDGFTDGSEILGGFDPLSDVRESVIVYDSPKEEGVYREDILIVESVAPLATAEVTPATTTLSEALRVTEAAQSLMITGRGLPSSFVTLYIYSTPVIVTVRTNDEGAFEYRFDQELDDGEHNVYVGITDNAGRIIAKSQPYRFLKEAQAITPLQAASLETIVTTDSATMSGANAMLYTIISISVVAIGLVLIMLGWRLESRRKQYAYSESDALV